MTVATTCLENYKESKIWAGKMLSSCAGPLAALREANRADPRAFVAASQEQYRMQLPYHIFRITRTEAYHMPFIGAFVTFLSRSQ